MAEQEVATEAPAAALRAVAVAKTVAMRVVVVVAAMVLRKAADVVEGMLLEASLLKAAAASTGPTALHATGFAQRVVLSLPHAVQQLYVALVGSPPASRSLYTLPSC